MPCRVWLDNDVSNQANVTTLVADYAAHNISVGAVDIDSGWSTGFNNFVVDTGKFPNMSALVEQLHAKDIKIILWATSMVDTDSSNYNTALSKDYFVKNLFDKFTPLKWWHGKGGLLDYTCVECVECVECAACRGLMSPWFAVLGCTPSNPEAVEWWHSQLDNVLDIGIDGWKCDGTGACAEAPGGVPSGLTDLLACCCCCCCCCCCFWGRVLSCRRPVHHRVRRPPRPQWRHFLP